MNKALYAVFIAAKYVPTIVKLVQNKFSKEYNKAQQDRQLYNDDLTELSAIFQGNMDLEQKKQNFFKIMVCTKKEVIEFLKSYQFQKLYNTKEIQDYYYNKENGYCIINLKEIEINQYSIFTKECGSTNSVLWLNKALKKISFILIIYFQGQFLKNQFKDEFLNNFSDIFEFLQQEIVKRANACLKEPLNQIQNIYMKQYQQIIEYNKALDDLCLQLNSQKYNLKQLQEKLSILFKELINKFDEQVIEEMQIKYLGQLDNKKIQKFHVSNILTKKYHKIIINAMKEKILNSLQVYKQKDYKKEKEQIEKIILNQIEKQDFTDGIQNNEINQNLEVIIFSIDWSNLGIDGIKIQNLIIKLRDFQLKEDKQNLNQISVNDADKALKWYQNNVDESTNLIVICQIYMILANYQFQQSKIYFGEYDSDARNILFHIVKHLNDLKFGYFNHLMIKFCEMTTHQIQSQIFEEIKIKIKKDEQQQHSQTGELFKSRSVINLSGSTSYLCLQDKTAKIVKSPSIISKEYYKKNELFYLILNKQNKSLEKCKEEQSDLIKQQFELLEEQIKIKQKKGEYQFIKELNFPDLLFFETLSQDQNNSNVITLVISGFCSKHENKKDQWKQVLNQFSGTVIALHWETKQLFDFVIMINQMIVSSENILEESLIRNPFEKAYEQTSVVGRYLAHFLDGGQLFGGRQINIMCHSLGSQILLECVHELDRFSKKKLINDIIIFGGVADIVQLQKRRWNSVSGSVNNIYSDKDFILNYCFKVSKLFENPCGLYPVELGYKKILNYDVTKDVDGHLKYWENLNKIINISDFNSDFKVLVKNIVETD